MITDRRCEDADPGPRWRFHSHTHPRRRWDGDKRAGARRFGSNLKRRRRFGGVINSDMCAPEDRDRRQGWTGRLDCRLKWTTQPGFN